jgi:hypothetical protein
MNEIALSTRQRLLELEYTRLIEGTEFSPPGVQQRDWDPTVICRLGENDRLDLRRRRKPG